MNDTELELVIGDKNLSTWSMRAWLAVKHSGIQFREHLVLLDRPETGPALKKLSPSETVPCLIHGDLRVWDSLAICEYIAELAPSRKLWPEDRARRAIARAYVAEMHSGFSALRSQMSMDLRLRMEIRHLTEETVADVERIRHLWETALKVSGGPFLFGEFGIADAFFAPVVFRFQSYGVRFKSSAIHRYLEAVRTFPIVAEWAAAAEKEIPPEVIF